MRHPGVWRGGRGLVPFFGDLQWREHRKAEAAFRRAAVEIQMQNAMQEAQSAWDLVKSRNKMMSGFH